MFFGPTHTTFSLPLHSHASAGECKYCRVSYSLTKQPLKDSQCFHILLVKWHVSRCTLSMNAYVCLQTSNNFKFSFFFSVRHSQLFFSDNNRNHVTLKLVSNTTCLIPDEFWRLWQQIGDDLKCVNFPVGSNSL